jgi:hypothetical protein
MIFCDDKYVYGESTIHTQHAGKISAASIRLTTAVGYSTVVLLASSSMYVDGAFKNFSNGYFPILGYHTRTVDLLEYSSIG